MQQSCSSCLARRTWVMRGIRSYGAVPKPPGKPHPSGETSVRKSPRARFGLSESSAGGERVNRPQGSTTNGETSKARSGGSRRSRLAGFLDGDGTVTSNNAGEYTPRTPYGSTASEASRTKHSTRTDGSRSSLTNRETSMHGRKPLYPPPRNSTTEVSKPRQSIREPLYPSPQPSRSEEPSSSRRKYHFKSLHHDTAIQAFHRPSTHFNPIIKYRDNYLFLRAAPTHTLPMPPPLPFPPDLPSLAMKHPSMEIINFGVVASKNAVSPFAPERGRVRKRFKAAVEEVVNKGSGDVRSDWSYLAVLNREVYEADMRDLCGSLENGLKFIRRQQERGIGSDAGQSLRRR